MCVGYFLLYFFLKTEEMDFQPIKLPISLGPVSEMLKKTKIEEDEDNIFDNVFLKPKRITEEKMQEEKLLEQSFEEKSMEPIPELISDSSREFTSSLPVFSFKKSEIDRLRNSSDFNPETLFVESSNDSQIAPNLKKPKKTAQKKQTKKRREHIPLNLNEGDIEIRQTSKTYKSFNTQEECEEWLQKNNLKLLIIAEDIQENKGWKRYYCSSVENICSIIKKRMNQKKFSFFYEIIRDCPTHLYFDLDASIELNKEKDFEGILEKFKGHIKDLYKQLYNIENPDEELVFQISRSENIEKFSVHIVVKHKEKCFKNSFHVGEFVNKLIKKIMEYENIEDFSESEFWIKNPSKKNPERETLIFDDKVYTINRAFRIIGNTKNRTKKAIIYPTETKKEDITEKTIESHMIQTQINTQNLFECYDEYGCEPFSNAKLNFVDFFKNKKDPLMRLFTEIKDRKHYWLNEFPLDKFWEIYGTVKNIELSADIREGHSIKTHRKIFCSTKEEFKKNVLEYYGNDLMIVAVGYGREQPNYDSKIVSGNVVLDIDIPEFKIRDGKNIVSLRKCCGELSTFCSNCYKILSLSFYVCKFILDTILCIDKEKYHIYFSGNKGIHIVIFDEEYRKNITIKERSTILSIFSYKEYYANFLLKKTEVIDILNRILTDENLYKPQRNNYTLKNLLKDYWPTFDRSITTEIGHLSKVIYSLHSKTNRIAEPILDPEDFFSTLLKKDFMK